LNRTDTTTTFSISSEKRILQTAAKRKADKRRGRSRDMTRNVRSAESSRKQKIELAQWLMTANERG
jgi:hypothetical protein